MPKGFSYVDVWRGEKNNASALMAYVHPAPSGCWEWNGTRLKSGYGKITVDYKTVLAHRYFYEQIVGPITDSLQLDHLCKNRCCVNPDHLEQVTQKENLMRGDGFSAQNSRKTKCSHGHNLVGDNLYHPPKRPLRRYCKACARARAAEFERRKIAGG